MLELGIKAPDFELPDQNGEVHKLSDYAGKKVILYFYPKDNTPGIIVILQDSSIKMEFYRRLYRENSIKPVKSRFRSQNPGIIMK